MREIGLSFQVPELSFPGLGIYGRVVCQHCAGNLPLSRYHNIFLITILTTPFGIVLRTHSERRSVLLPNYADF